MSCPFTLRQNEQLQSLVTRCGLNYYPNTPSCEQEIICEENVRLTKELAKFTSSKEKMSLDDLLSKQRSPNNQYVLGHVPYATKKKSNKKKNQKNNTVPSSLPNMPNFVKEGEMSKASSSTSRSGVSGVSRPESPGKPESPARKTGVSAPTHNDFAGKYNPSYVLCRDYKGHVYAKYVGL